MKIPMICAYTYYIDGQLNYGWQFSMAASADELEAELKNSILADEPDATDIDAFTGPLDILSIQTITRYYVKRYILAEEL